MYQHLTVLVKYRLYVFIYHSHIFMPLPMMRQTHSVFGLFICVCDHTLKGCEHDILETAGENFTKFTT